MLRYTKAAAIDSVFNQLSLVWSRMDIDLRKDIPEPTENTTIADFIAHLETREDIWKEQAARRQNKNQVRNKNPGFSQGNRNVTGTTVAQRLPFRPGPRPFYNQYRMANATMYPQYQNNFPNVYSQIYGQPYYPQAPYTPRFNGNVQSQYTPRAPQRPWYPPRNWNQIQTPRQNPQSPTDQKQLEAPPQQLMISDKPANPPRNNGSNNAPAFNKGPIQPWNRRQTAYHVDTSGNSTVETSNDWTSNHGHQDQYPLQYPPSEYQDPYEEADYDEYQEAFPVSEEQYQQTEDTEDSSEAFLLSTVKDPFSCHFCTEDFPSRNSLLLHASTSHSRKEDHDHRQIPSEVVVSSKKYEGTAGYAFRPWRYATAKLLLNDSSDYVEACLDTGCTMTVINKGFAHSLGITTKKISPISLTGIGSKHQSSEFALIRADIPARIGTRQILARISMEAHLVEQLATKLLIGIDVLGTEGITICPRSEAACN
jgi:hypothetical protein